ncbi:T9SS type A sorting domain-containing protein [Neolewinella sp.]|uniref:T9SS type A sorting domain-containing protein n=1 Tax=Neolewinella sp. TaxID=2993543 RepID=UPI003B51A814
MYLRLLLTLLAILPTLLSATHNRGGEIIVRTAGCESPSDQLTACATIITYTETAQTEVDRDSLLLHWGDGTSEMIGRTRITPVTPGVQRNEYALCHRYADFGRYVLHFQDFNRQRGVRNMPFSVNIPFSVFTSFALLDPSVNGCNSSPELTQHPVDNACINSVWTHNPGAFDRDGDSLAFAFTTPTYDGRTEIPNYVLPNLVAGVGGSLSIDPRTGQITWDSPQLPGEYNLTYMVKSFRNGMPLDTVVRDLQLFIDNCANEPPVVELAQEELSVVAGEVVEFDVVATGSPSEDQQVKLTAGGRPFDLADNPATFLPTEGNIQSDPLRKTFRWTPTSDDISKQTYFVVLRAEDDGPPAPTGLATVRTISIRVVAPPPPTIPAAYQLFRPSVQYLYENPNFSSRTFGFDTEFYGVRLDSLGCGDLYGSLEEVYHDDGSCVIKVPSPFGYRICQTADSTVMHFGADQQLVLYQSAAIGTRWVARDSSGVRLYAEVLSITPATVLGMPDTLKAIGFFTEGGEVAGPTVTVAKYAGLVDGSRFYRIGQEELPLTLAGLSEPARGVQLPAAASYGLAQVGDTFQIEASNPDYLGEPFVGREGFAGSFFTVVVLAVDSSQEGVYTYDVVADLYRPERGVMVPFALDTVFTFSQPRLPAEMVRQPGARQDSTRSGAEYSNVLKVFRDSCGLFHQRLSTPANFADSDSCGFDQAGLDANPGPVYVEGVPFDLDAISTMGGPRSVRLQYLGTDTRRCGTYLEQDDILLSDETLPVSDGLPIEVYPNPTNDQLIVEVPAETGPCDLAVYSLSGRRLRAVRDVRNQHILSLGELPAGAYLLVVSGEGRSLVRQRVIVR